MNKHILLVMQWLKDKNSVSLDELKENRKSAFAADAYDAFAAYAAWAAAADAAQYWVNEYFERSDEDKSDYEEKLK